MGGGEGTMQGVSLWKVRGGGGTMQGVSLTIPQPSLAIAGDSLRKQQLIPINKLPHSDLQLLCNFTHQDSSRKSKLNSKATKGTNFIALFLFVSQTTAKGTVNKTCKSYLKQRRKKGMA